MHILSQAIEYLKGVGPSRAELLKKELGIFRNGDLLMDFPFRYVDRSKIIPIIEIQADSKSVQLRGKITKVHREGSGRKKRLRALLTDETGSLELIWFRGLQWVDKLLEIGKEYVVFGKLGFFNGTPNIAHPEMESYTSFRSKGNQGLAAVYHSTEKLNARGLDSKARRKIMQQLLDRITERDLPETLPQYLIDNQQLMTRFQALRAIHRPRHAAEALAARKRLKFEELFYIQMALLKKNQERKDQQKGYQFAEIGSIFHRYYNEILPFELTGAQKKVLREIRQDLASGFQMNRLLQGDVGSGKTIVSLLTVLMAVDNGYQSCLMAPTEILAQQHYQSFKEYFDELGLVVDFLSGSVRAKDRREVLARLASGESHLIIGTHALIEDPVIFQNLGLAITDEQHRFGVKQRARLWAKARNHSPHVLVMTATPIPRTLAMTSYGDLDVSVIDELPPGRKPIQTLHKRETQRPQVIAFMHDEIKKGRQIYVVYPLIEESAKLDLENLHDGYEQLLTYFPRPEYQMSIVHGRMKPEDKDIEMGRFADAKTQILVATTVIEVGVNVPNASVMIIENAERFGLSQLHQLRGRVGRGAEQSYCILMSGYKLSHEAKKRIATMCSTNDGFEISQVDLELRGPGNIQGTQQSGSVPLKIADLVKDGMLLSHVRSIAKMIISKDPDLSHAANSILREQLEQRTGQAHNWSKIG